MKTKVLLSTMVLAAALAGCSQDEWGVNNANTSNLDNRRSVGKVELSLTDPSTRMEETAEGAIVFSADDKVGAHLMDEFGGKYPVYGLTNYAQSNYPFQQNGDVWESTGVLLEGNYFFTYPFNGCQQDRNAVINTVPVNQYAYDQETGEFNSKQSYIDNQFYVGYKYLHADEECEDCDEVGTLTAHVNMEKVHAYPIFRFVNQTGAPFGSDLKVYKVSLRKADCSPFYNTVAVFPEAMKFKADPYSEDEDGKYDLWKTAVYNRNMPNQPHCARPFDAKDVCNSKTLEYNLLFPEGGLEVQNWSSFEVWMTVPAGIYGKMQVILYTNEGVGTYDIDMPNTDDDSQVQSGTYAFVPKRTEINIRIDINSLLTNQYNFTVQSTENLIEYLKYIEGTGTTTKIELTTIGNEVELNQEVYKILENKNLKLKLRGTLVIPEGVAENAIDRIDYYYAGARLINEGVQVIKKTPMKEKATIGAANVKIDNVGTLTLKAAMPASMINNYGTLNVEKSSVHTLLNMPGATTNVLNELNVINLINLGQMNVNADAKVNVLAKWFNMGTTINEGVITTWPMDMTNPTFITLTKAELESIKASYDGLVIEENFHHWDVDILVNIYNTFIAASAEAVNFGTIENKGTIDCKGVIVRATIEGITGTWYKPFVEFDLTFNITDEVAAVTSLVNLGSFSEINTYGRIANLSNFGMLIPQPGSTTSLVEMHADDITELDKAKEAAKLYVQGDLAFYGYGFIDQTNNDKKLASGQATISGQGEALDGSQQIIFVKRTGNADFGVTAQDTDAETSAPKYINTIWFENATATVNKEYVDISGKNFWMSGVNTVTIYQGKTLTLGPVAITGTANFKGDGNVALTDDIYVNGGTLNADNKAWTAATPVTIWGFGSSSENDLNTEGTQWNSNIKIDYKSFDYVGPWIVIE